MPDVLGLTVEVQRFAFAGNQLIDSAQLEAVVAPYLHRPLPFRELQAAAAAVAAYYRQAGWVVQSYVPAQDLAEGVVTIQVLETTRGALQFERSLSLPRLQARVEQIFAAQLPAGQPLSAAQLERATLLGNDLPGVRVDAALAPGATPQRTDVVVSTQDKPSAFLEVYSDNAGAESTGVYRLGANGHWGNLLGDADRLAWNWLHSDGSDYARLAWGLPLGPYGWRWGLNTAHFDYRLSAPSLSALQGAGSASMAGLEASYPLLRAQRYNLQLNLAYDHKRFDNRAIAAVVSRYAVDTLGLGLDGNRFDADAGNAFSTASLQWVSGQLDLDGSPNQATDALTTQAAGRFNKLRYSLSRQQDIRADLLWYAALTGQVADKNLDSSEKLYLGGSDGVRAFPSNEAGGSEGTLLNLELRWRLAAAWTLAAFYDWGEILVNRYNSFSGAATPNRYALQGGGLALSWQSGAGAKLALSWARRGQANPNPSANGNDQDGTLLVDRIGASLHLFF